MLAEHRARTALDNVVMAPVRVLKRPKEEVEAQARRLIKKVRLKGKEDAYPGRQHRVTIARSLAMNPDIMLFDEVTAALDPKTVKEVPVSIRELAGKYDMRAGYTRDGFRA